MTAESRSRSLQGTSSPNDVLDATSFLFGTNARFVEGLYAQYLKDPGAVDGTWRAFFEALGDKLDPGQVGQGPSWRRGTRFDPPRDELESALSGEWPTPAKAADAKGAFSKAAAAPTSDAI